MRTNASFATSTLLSAAMLTAGGLLACGAARGATDVVIGSAEFAKPDGEGWGTSMPTKLYNGGDPSGLMNEIRWTSWGGNTSIGYGLNSIFKPGGGYYSRPVIIELRAQKLGKCSSSGPRAYTQLYVRGPSRPEGLIGAWHSWSATSLCQFGF